MNFPSLSPTRASVLSKKCHSPLNRSQAVGSALFCPASHTSAHGFLLPWHWENRSTDHFCSFLSEKLSSMTLKAPGWTCYPSSSQRPLGAFQSHLETCRRNSVKCRACAFVLHRFCMRFTGLANHIQHEHCALRSRSV